jgi:hypothetical protein
MTGAVSAVTEYASDAVVWLINLNHIPLPVDPIPLESCHANDLRYWYAPTIGHSALIVNPIAVMLTCALHCTIASYSGAPTPTYARRIVVTVVVQAGSYYTTDHTSSKSLMRYSVTFP